MNHKTQRGLPIWLILLLTLAIVVGLSAYPSEAAPLDQAGVDGISTNVMQQIQALLAEKEARSPAQQKIDSNLLFTLRQSRGQAVANGVQSLETGVAVNANGMTEVDITAQVSQPLLDKLARLGVKVLSQHAAFNSIRALVPLDQLETIAEDKAIIFIQPKQEAMTTSERVPPSPIRPSFEARAARVQAQLLEVLPAIAGAQLPGADVGIQATNTSEGDVTHRANLVRSGYGVNGAGVKIGVLSDGVNSLAALQASGDLPAVTVLPGQAGSGNEGAAMLEIVHDLAPGAQLYFASGFNGIASFAQNILDLRAAGCDIIIDDLTYYVETPFQKGQAGSVTSPTNGGIVTQAVNTVAENGALYFSSAANSGNKNDNTSGTWEGDFVNGGAVGSPISGSGTLHNFDPSGTTAYNTITSTGGPATLFWSDPLGGSSNDYDLFQLNGAGTALLAASTNVQNGMQDPFEQLNSTASGTRLVIVKRSGAADRFLHLNTNRGRLNFNTAGNTHGHNAPPHPNAFSVAASPAAAGLGGTPTGPYPGVFNGANLVETFSSDGPRQYFFNADSSPITPGNFLAGGGQVLLKPDVTAADGVQTAAPGFNPFYGTSAAAPHAGAIAALVKSAQPSLTATQIRNILLATAIDIEAAGTDRDSGVGILDALAAVQATGISPRANLVLRTVSAAPLIGDGDGFIEPNEQAALNIQLKNDGVVNSTAISATLVTTTSGVTMLAGTSAYTTITPGGSQVNITPFTFGLAPGVPCGATLNFKLTVAYSGGSAISPKVFSFSQPSGQPGGTTTVAYTGPAVAVPDNNSTGVNIPLTVSGASGAVGDLNLRLDGSVCSTAAGATTVGVDHTWVGDLTFKLKSPANTSVTFINRPGGSSNGGNNFCQTLLDDQGGFPSIGIITAAGAPYTGSFSPQAPFSAFNGEAANGVWTLNVSDNAAVDTGSVRAFSLFVSGWACNAPAPNQNYLPIVKR